MAKGKKSKRSGVVSKGERKSQDPKWKKIARKEWKGSTAQMIAKVAAFRAGRNVMFTIPNPNKNETNKRFIRVNAKDILK